jgi:hypothetical protein
MSQELDAPERVVVGSKVTLEGEGGPDVKAMTAGGLALVASEDVLRVKSVGANDTASGFVNPPNSRVALVDAVSAQFALNVTVTTWPAPDAVPAQAAPVKFAPSDTDGDAGTTICEGKTIVMVELPVSAPSGDEVKPIFHELGALAAVLVGTNVTPEGAVAAPTIATSGAVEGVKSDDVTMENKSVNELSTGPPLVNPPRVNVPVPKAARAQVPLSVIVTTWPKPTALAFEQFPVNPDPIVTVGEPGTTTSVGNVSDIVE